MYEKQNGQTNDKRRRNSEEVSLSHKVESSKYFFGLDVAQVDAVVCQKCFIKGLLLRCKKVHLQHKVLSHERNIAKTSLCKKSLKISLSMCQDKGNMFY